MAIASERKEGKRTRRVEQKQLVLSYMSLLFDPSASDLPIVEVFDATKQHLSEQNTLLITAPPGAGKSTLLPLALLDAPWLKGKKILLLEPRRLAARSIAQRMADLLDQKPGETVGYRIRFENKTSAATRLEVLTEGILTRMLQTDNALEDVGLVIFDEFHERSIHADTALALCREAQSILRPDLRIVVMSATLDMPILEELLQCPAVVSEGRQYPVDIHYSGDADPYLLPELAAKTIAKAMKEHTGDVLAFFPGQGEIVKCAGLLTATLPAVEIHPLYGALPFGKQQAAIRPSRNGKRKVVLATSIAETSLTIEGIGIVVDSGFGRRSQFDPKSGLSRLVTVKIDQDTATQRAGRAGRLGPGVCYRMWTKATHSRLLQHRAPEIEEADLCSLLLNLSEWGISDPNTLTWVSPPPTGAVKAAVNTLEELEALSNGSITAHGKAMNKLPCHPRIGHCLLVAQTMDELALATDVAAVLEERDPLPKGAGIDINLRIEALRRQRAQQKLARYFNRIEQVASNYRRMFKTVPDNGTYDPYTTGILIVQAYPERIAAARPGNNAQFQLANGRLAMAGHKDELAYEPWLAVAHLDARDGMGKIFMAAPLNPTDLAPMVKTIETVRWDTKKGGLLAQAETKIGSILLQTKPLPEPDPSLRATAICAAIQKEGEQLLPFSKEVIQWQHRVATLKKWQPTAKWPDTSTAALLASAPEWLAPYVNNIKKPAELKQLDLLEILHYHLTSEQQKALPVYAPERIAVPTGSKIRLNYQANGSAPVLEVRLQELFGLAKTPSVNQGKVAVLLHLLSPGYKPVQITSDLENFWNNTYFDVRKDLRGRYPKHVWPDDPWNEPPIRGTKRRPRK